MIAVELKYVDPNNGDHLPLPDCQKIKVSPVEFDYGQVEFDYPSIGHNFSLMRDDDEFEIAVYLDGVLVPELGAIVRDASGDDIKEDGIYTFSGSMMLTLLDEGNVYPKGWPTYDPKDVNTQVTNATGGQIVKQFVNLSQARGAMPGITTSSFSATADSNGNAWTKMISLEIKPGTTITTLLKSLQGNGLCDFKMVGRDLRLYNPDTYNVDRTLTDPPLVFRKGRDISESPRKRSTQGRATVVLAAGKEDAGVYVEQADPTALATIGRRIEGYVSNGNIIDKAVLGSYATYQLQELVLPKIEKTHGLAFIEDGSPRPVLDFNVSDWAFTDVGRGLERYRIKQWVLDVDAKGLATGSVTLNDMFDEATVMIGRRVAGILGGTNVTGASQAVDAIPPDVINNIAPNPPTGLTLNSDVYTTSSGQIQAFVTASWTAPTLDSDGGALTDLAGYYVQWRTSEMTGWEAASTDASTTSATFSSITPNVIVTVQVAAFDKYGNTSVWSASKTILAAKDTTPPEAPSAPTVSNYMGLLRIDWDGKTASGAAWPADFAVVEVHASQINNFTPSSTTLLNQLSTAGKTFFNIPYGSTGYAKLVAVDSSGNRSAVSAQASGTVSQVVSADVFAGAIGSAQLADLAVTNAKINDLAVNDAKIGNVSVGKLTAGTMSADVTISGRFATALTGARVEMNALGFQKFASDGITKLISLTGTEALLTGIYKTASSGRRIEIGAGGDNGAVSFISPTGITGKLTGYTAVPVSGPNQEGVQIVMPISGTSFNWNAVNVQNDETISAMSAAVQAVVGGDSASSSKGFYVIWTPVRVPDANNSFPQAANEVERFGVQASNIFLADNAGHGTMYNYSADGTTEFYPAVTSYAHNISRLVLTRQTSSSSAIYSPSVGFVTQDNVGAKMRLNSQLGFEFINFSEIGYTSVNAQAFTVNSDGATKTAISAYKEDALAILRSTPVRRYRRKSTAAKAGKFKDPQGRSKMAPAGSVNISHGMEIGLVSQEAPEQIRRPMSGGLEGIDLYQYTALIHAAVAQLASKLDEIA